MSRSLTALCLVLSGCSFAGGGGDSDRSDSGPGDGDAAVCAPTCSGDELLTCPDMEPISCPLGCDQGACNGIVPSNGADDHTIEPGAVDAWVLNVDAIINTDDGSITGGGLGARTAGAGVLNGIGYEVVGGVAVFVVDSLTIEADIVVTVTGSLPLVIRAAHDVNIEGQINAGAGAVACGLPAQRSCGGPGGGVGGDAGQAPGGCAPGGNGDQGGGGTAESGGGGGGYRTSGAKGGDADGSTGGGGGDPASCPGDTLVPLVGGSGGGRGGDEDDEHAGGGGGGGAIQISSNTRIVFTGTPVTPAGILAAGAGGGGGGNDEGGAGGGSGGAILLEAPAIDMTDAVLAANGGAGGGADQGQPGQDGRFSDQAASGGNDGGSGTNGGDGGTNSNPQPGGDTSNPNDAGGGGGAAGRIRLNRSNGMAQTSITSPTATTGPIIPR